MTTTQAPKIYPGLVDQHLEFFKMGNQLKVMSFGSVKSFNAISTPVYQMLKDAMLQDENAYNILKEWFPTSEIKQLEKFTECRFGGLDYRPDITACGLQNAEYWDCPMRGQCKGEGVVCKKLSYKNQELDAIDIKMLKSVATNLTNEVIAENLELPLGTFHKIKQSLYSKLGIQTKQEATIIALELHLI